MIKKALFFAGLVLSSLSVQALTFTAPAANDDLIGQIQYYPGQPSDTLSNLGMQSDAGRDDMRTLNPQFDPDDALPGAVPVVIPTRYLLPNYPREGIVVNLSEKRLYYYVPGKNLVMTFPIGIGKQGAMTPLGQTYVAAKKKDPSWTPPESIREFNKKNGIILPRTIQGGPDNPLGRRAIYLGIPTYLIHASNFPQSIGSRGSFGCMRMMESDIDQLFPLIEPKTKVMIIEEPFKAGWSAGNLYLEIHAPLEENRGKTKEYALPVLHQLLQLSYEHHVPINWYLVKQAMKNQLGMPTLVSDSANSATEKNIAPAPAQWPSDTTLCRLSGVCSAK